MICIKTKIPKKIFDIDDNLRLFIIVKILFVYGFLKIELKEINLLTRQLEC